MLYGHTAGRGHVRDVYRDKVSKGENFNRLNFLGVIPQNASWFFLWYVKNIQKNTFSEKQQNIECHFFCWTKKNALISPKLPSMNVLL